MAEPMRALTVRQPFAWAIAYGGKDVENRPRPLSYRGPVAIHAGLAMHSGSIPVRDAAIALDALGGRGNCWQTNALRVGKPEHPGLALGAVIAVAEIAGCHHADECMLPPHLVVTRTGCSGWAARDQFHIELASVRPLPKPIPAKGKLGLWRLPGDVEKAVREQLGLESAQSVPFRHDDRAEGP